MAAYGENPMAAVTCGTQPANISLTARRAQPRRTATSPADHTHHHTTRMRQITNPHLTKDSPYQ